MGGNRELAERFITSLEARDWGVWAGLLHPAVVYEIPQSRERIRGRDRYLRFNQEYPGDWHLRPKVTIADERHGVVWFEWLLDGRADDAMAFFEFADGLITRVTDFWPEPYEPPPGREHLVERWLPGPRGSQSRSLTSVGAADGAVLAAGVVNDLTGDEACLVGGEEGDEGGGVGRGADAAEEEGGGAHLGEAVGRKVRVGAGGGAAGADGVDRDPPGGELEGRDPGDLVDERFRAGVQRTARHGRGLDTEVLLAEPRVAALPADHRLAGRREIRRADLAGEPLPRWSDPATMAARAFWTGTDTQPGPGTPAPPDPGDYAERAGPLVSDMNQLLDAVALGQAIAFIPASVASRHAVPDLAFVPVTDLSPSTVMAAWPEGSKSPAIARFLRTAAEVAASPGSRSRKSAR